MAISKEIFGLAAMLLTFAAFLPYIRAILRGETKPHVYSWIIWGAGTFIVALAQLSGGAGIGAWPIAVSGLITIGVAVLAFVKSSELEITRSDWCFLIFALSALPLWCVTQTALYAVIILTIVDLLGFGPSVRKAIDRPQEENVLFFLLGALRNLLVILALEAYSWTTVLFPAAVGVACVLFVVLILSRRAVMKAAQS